MKHSIIYKVINKVISNLVSYYNSSLTRRAVNKILIIITMIFSDSVVFKMLTNSDYSIDSKKRSSIINISEKVFNWTVKNINSFMKKGINGSIALNLLSFNKKAPKQSKGLFYIYMMTSTIIFYDIYSIATGAFSMNKAVVTFAAISLLVFNKYADISIAFRESIIRKIINEITEFHVEEGCE